MKCALACLALSLAFASASLAFSEPDGLAALPPERGKGTFPRVALTPMVGMVHGVPGIGLELGVGLGPVVVGARATAGNDLPIMDPSSDGESQLSLLAGMRHELGSAVVTVRSGISQVERHTSAKKDPAETGSNAEWYIGYSHFKGLGVPVTLDLLWGSRFVGGNLSMTAMFDRDGGSFGAMVGMPLGYLHR